jgi:hypothetical protein
MLIVSSEKISIKGKPEIVFTENKEPDNPSVTENNCPEVPNTLNILPPAVRPWMVVTSVEPEIYSDPVTDKELDIPAELFILKKPFLKSMVCYKYVGRLDLSA